MQSLGMVNLFPSCLMGFPSSTWSRRKFLARKGERTARSSPSRLYSKAEYPVASMVYEWTWRDEYGFWLAPVAPSLCLGYTLKRSLRAMSMGYYTNVDH